MPPSRRSAAPTSSSTTPQSWSSARSPRCQTQRSTRQIEVNVSGVFRTLREAARRLRDGGRIVNFSSSVVGLYQPRYAAYAATKAAIEAMTHVVAKELASRGITVNAVAPGPTETEMFLGDKSPEQLRAHRRDEPVRPLRTAAGNCRRRRLPGEPRGHMGERPDPARQWRRGLTSGGARPHKADGPAFASSPAGSPAQHDNTQGALSCRSPTSRCRRPR